MSILIVDDDLNLNEMIKEILSVEGFITASAYNGEEAIRLLFQNKDIELVILDVMMPEFDGWDTLDYIKKHFDVKVLMLTALGDEYDEVKGLRLGADDYIAKPFKRMVLIERIKRLLNMSSAKKPIVYKSAGLVLNVPERKLYIDGINTKITPKEFNLLLMFLKNPKIVLTRELILDKIWGYEYFGNDRTIDTHIKMLRHTLGKYSNLICTIRGLGYSFDAEVIKE